MITAATMPRQSRFRLLRAQVPSCLLEIPGLVEPPPHALQTRHGLTRVDLDIVDGHIHAVHLTGSAPKTTAPVVDLDHSQVWPGFVDLHTHLDKGHIWPRRENPDGTFMGARQAMRDERPHWSATDIAARMDFSLRCAYAHGTVALRTHLDSMSPQHRMSWPVFAELRAAWADRIELQAVSLVSIDTMQETVAEELADLVADHGGVFGAVTYQTPHLEHHLDRAFRLAMERGLELDFHVDESLDPEARSLLPIAETALRLAFPGRIVVGHCCSLSVQPEAIIDMTLDKVEQAGIAVVSLPMCNLYLQDRTPGRTPRRRGVTLLHEMQQRGIEVAVASDNVRDPFYGYGDLDMLEVFTQATRIAHLDRPVDSWPASVTRTPARLMGCNAGVIKPGALADLVICEGRSFDEVLSRPQARRVVLRRGAPIDTVPPDYRQLDHLFPARSEALSRHESRP